jgi:manganese/zinc/iron transport system permease protein
MEENILKCLLQHHMPVFSLSEIRLFFSFAPIFLLRMRMQQLIVKKGGKYHLTKKGKKKARHILHLHALWEIYLEKYIGGQKENIHMHAEEMEHVISSEIEKKLHVFLRNREQSHD